MLQKATPVFARLVLMELFILSTSRKKINNLKRLEDLVSEQAQRLERLEQENQNKTPQPYRLQGWVEASNLRLPLMILTVRKKNDPCNPVNELS
ncbi:MAG: hypothetical protein D3907_09135, partial [Candidatus Electrothrix sp. AUS3]|nr:hypothetical protein [Candidatus Electrothrix gigas]